jgi:hypothetical protein
MSTFDPDKVERKVWNHDWPENLWVRATDYDNLLRLYRRMESTREVVLTEPKPNAITDYIMELRAELAQAKERIVKLEESTREELPTNGCDHSFSSNGVCHYCNVYDEVNDLNKKWRISKEQP